VARKAAKPKKEQRKAQNQPPLKQTPPNHLNARCPPYIHIIMFLLSTTHLARVQPTLCTISPPLAMNSSNTNREKNGMLYMRSKLGCFTRYASKYLSNYTQSLCQDLQNKSESSQRDHDKITSK
jgi:hypothetical protein